MLKQIKEANEKIISNHLSEALGENYEISCIWGFPVTIVEINQEIDNKTNRWRLAMDLVERNYEIGTYGSKKEDDQEKPDWSTIDKNVIEFITQRIEAISVQFFTTRPKPKEPEQPKEEKESIKENEKKQ